MDDLITFLRARVDEREAKARAAGGDNPSDWYTATGLADSDAWNLDLADAEHIADNDPAHVLADIAATRLLIDQCEQLGRYATPSPDAIRLANGVLRALATIHNRHPDYRPEWSTL